MTTDQYCRGCRDDFYNGRNDLGVKRCWSLDKAKLRKRYRIGSNVPMNIKEAYEAILVPTCFRQPGYAILDAIPEYAQTKSEREAEAKRQQIADEKETKQAAGG